MFDFMMDEKPHKALTCFLVAEAAMLLDAAQADMTEEKVYE